MLLPIDKVRMNEIFKRSSLDLVFYQTFHSNIFSKSYTDEELLDYFYEIAEKRLLDDSKRSEKILYKIIYSIHIIIDNYEISSAEYMKQLDEKQTKITKLFNEYCNCFTQNCWQKIQQVLMGINAHRLFLFYKEPEPQEQPQFKVEEKKLDFDEESQLLKSQLSSLETGFKKREATIQKLTLKLNELEKKVNDLTKEKNVLKEEKEDLFKEIEEYQKVNEKLQIETEYLTQKKQKLDDDFIKQKQKLDDLKHQLEELSEFKQIYEAKNNFLNSANLDALELELITLLRTPKTINELKQYFKKYFHLSELEFSSLYQKVTSYINVGTQKVTLPKTYQIMPPPIREKIIFNIQDFNPLKILFISDIHSRPESLDFFKSMDTLYDYAKKKRIKYILNLGDIFDTGNLNFNDEESIKQYYERWINYVKEWIKLYPQDDNICQAILGGNHDMKLVNLGFDVLKFLEENRTDIVSLGYNDAYLMINDHNYIGLHHPHIFGEINFQNISACQRKILEVQKQAGIKEVFLEVLGHYHKLIYRPEAKMLFLGSYFPNNSLSKPMNVIEATIYLNLDQTISYIVLKDLFFQNNDLLCNSELIHERKK